MDAIVSTHVPPPPLPHTHSMQHQVHQVRKETQSVLPFILPFLKTCCVYFVLWPSDNSPSLLALVCKCLPILCLMSYVFYHGIKDTSPCFYNKSILAGLFCCCVGDALLVWQEIDELFFLVGMGSFAVGLIIYAIAFGFRPFGVKELALALVAYSIIYVVLFPSLYGFMAIAVTVYGSLLTMLGWRAMARFTLKDLDIPWRKVYAFAGIFLFIVSDVVLAYDKFCGRVVFGREIVMTTYYAAQCCIALSIINHNLLITEQQSAKQD